MGPSRSAAPVLDCAIGKTTGLTQDELLGMIILGKLPERAGGGPSAGARD